MRFYTNPFKKDAEMVSAVRYGAWMYDGETYTREGVFQDWSRVIVYSDGSIRFEYKTKLILL